MTGGRTSHVGMSWTRRNGWVLRYWAAACWSGLIVVIVRSRPVWHSENRHKHLLWHIQADRCDQACRGARKSDLLALVVRWNSTAFRCLDRRTRPYNRAFKYNKDRTYSRSSVLKWNSTYSRSWIYEFFNEVVGAQNRNQTSLDLLSKLALFLSIHQTIQTKNLLSRESHTVMNRLSATFPAPANQSFRIPYKHLLHRKLTHGRPVYHSFHEFSPVTTLKHSGEINFLCKFC